MAHEKPCIVYKESFDPVDLTTVKIEHDVAGATRSKKVSVFKSAAGVEGLFYIIDKYVKAGERLGFDPRDYWESFEDVLDVTAESKWLNLIHAVTNAQKMRARFDTYTNRLVQACAQGDNPRDVLIDYIKEECKKPRKADTGTHASRVETLCRYANRLAGTAPELTEGMIKKLVFESFPDTWQNDYNKSHRRLEDDTSAQIVGYMNLCKSIADEEEEKRGKKRKGERIRGGGTSTGTKANEKKRPKTESSDVCPHHGGHTWHKCSLNPRGPNYGKIMGRGGRGGRGQGRGYSNYYDRNNGSNGGPGRGNGNGGGRGYGGFQGRGGRGPGRGSGYHNNGQHNNEQCYQQGNGGEQPDFHQGWTQSENYHYDGSHQSGSRDGWQSGRSSNEGSSRPSWY